MATEGPSFVKVPRGCSKIRIIGPRSGEKSQGDFGFLKESRLLLALAVPVADKLKEEKSVTKSMQNIPHVRKLQLYTLVN